MAMAFKGGYHLENFIFKGLNVDTIEGFVGIFLGIVSIGIILEALRSLRDFLRNRCYEQLNGAAEASCDEDQDPPCTISSILNSPRKNRRRVAQIETEPGPSSSQSQETRHLKRDCCDQDQDLEVSPQSQNIGQQTAASWTNTEQKIQNKSFLDLFIASILHSLYVVLGYIAMLAVMTFNYWILIAITIGISIGYFIFTYSRHLDIILADEKVLLEDHNDNGALERSQHSPTPTEDPDTKLLLNNSEKINTSSSDSSDNNSDKSSTDDNGNDGKKNNETVVGAQVHFMHESV